jgi:hypothetical protein
VKLMRFGIGVCVPFLMIVAGIVLNSYGFTGQRNSSPVPVPAFRGLQSVLDIVPKNYLENAATNLDKVQQAVSGVKLYKLTMKTDLIRRQLEFDQQTSLEDVTAAKDALQSFREHGSIKGLYLLLDTIGSVDHQISRAEDDLVSVDGLDESLFRAISDAHSGLHDVQRKFRLVSPIVFDTADALITHCKEYQ